MAPVGMTKIGITSIFFVIEQPKPEVSTLLSRIASKSVPRTYLALGLTSGHCEAGQVGRHHRDDGGGCQVDLGEDWLQKAQTRDMRR